MSSPPRRVRLIVDLFTGLVVVSVAVALAGLTWRLAGFAGTAAPAIAPVAPPAQAPADPATAIAAAPFGRESNADAPPTSLPLELRGVLLAVPREQSTALIAPNGGKPMPYGIGAAISGATIEDIGVDRVILRVNGRAESLAFPRPQAPGAAAAAVPDLSAGPSDAAPPLQSLGAPAAPPAPEGADIAAQIGAAPTADGYRINAPPSPAAARAGLQPGDVIRAVNGVALGDPARDRETLAAAQAAGAARVELIRDGQTITLSMPLR